MGRTEGNSERHTGEYRLIMIMWRERSDMIVLSNKDKILCGCLLVWSLVVVEVVK